jgi:cytochrome b6
VPVPGESDSGQPRSVLGAWLRERLPFGETLSLLREKRVPRHRHSVWYYFGGLSLFFLLVQFITGVLLAVYYRPTPEHAHESVGTIMYVAPYGWLIRSLHSWGANLMVGTVCVHMFSAFLMKAYRHPREVVWISGAGLLLLMLAFGFTGYLLPWDTKAYFATLIGTEIPKSFPLIGEWIVQLLRGGEDLGAETLTRMYALHVVILPLAAFVIACCHVVLNIYHGSSVPRGTVQRKPPFRFFPEFVYRDTLAWLAGLVALAALATMIPWDLGPKADTLASAPSGIRPEWYFLPLFQTLKMAPSNVFSVNGELIVNFLVALAILFWIAVPFIDRDSQHETTARVFTIVGVLGIAYFLGTLWLAWEG